MSFTRKWSSALLFLAVVSQSQNARADPSLQLSTTGEPEVNSPDDFQVIITLTNNGDVPLKLFNDPPSALNTAPTQTFKVTKTSDNSPAPFVGMVVKYSYDAETSFTNLAVGQSVDVTHELGSGYQFDSADTYSVTPRTTFYYADANGNPVPIQAELVNTHTAKLSGDNLKSRALEKRREYHNRMQMVKRDEITATTVNCAANQTDAITQSMYYASLYVASAEKYLSLHNATSPRYNAWFGAYSDDNHALVLSHYTKIRTSNVKTYTFDCQCNIDGADSTYAFVYPDAFGHIYLCEQYMLANVTGTDSKAGTLVHESTHFLANGGTLDLAYGHDQAGQLAQTNATAACNNADSHEYFAENANPWYA